MANTKISEMQEASVVNDNDYIPIVQSGVNKKAQASLIGTGGGADKFPIGAITGFAGTTPPENWLICDGSAISRIEYARLFSAIGTTYGVGDGSTTFNIPDLRGKVAVGLKSTDTDFDMLGETGGEKTHTLTVNEIPSHSHTTGYVTGNLAGNTYGMLSNVNTDGSSSTYAAGGGQAHNNLQPYMVTHYIIKAYDSATGSTDVETLPIGTELDFDGNVADIPTGWQQIDDPSVYSTTEQVIGKWINGKPLYRKVIVITTKDPTNIYLHGISNVDVFVDAYGAANFTGTGSGWQPVPRVVPTAVGEYGLGVGNLREETFSFGIGTSYGTFVKANIILEYTKTTD